MAACFEQADNRAQPCVQSDAIDLDATLDDLRIYNRALTTTEVAELAR